MQVSVLGATGYTGIELVGLLRDHPRVELALLASESFSGENIAEVYPHLKDIVEIECQSFDVDRISRASDIVFTALPHGVSQDIIPGLLERDLTVIDLSGDYRYRSAETYERWYQPHKSPELMEEAAYGLTELREEEIKNSRLIANPGCYPTASLLAVQPLLAEDLIEPEGIIIDAKSGVSGAGRGASRITHFCEVQENFKAYSVGCHRHSSEISEKLKIWNREEAEITFTPHLLPLKRGILATIYADSAVRSAGDELREKILKTYKDYYDHRPFMRVFADRNPQLKYVTGTNFCDLSANADEKGRIVIISAIDNLLKGAAGQAVQNMNAVCGWPEITGLDKTGSYI